jgi:hypothetical protein
MFGAERTLAVGIAHVLQPFAIGRLQRRCIFAIGGRIGRALRLQLLVQQAQRMRQRRTGGELRRRKDLAAAIGDRKRFAQMRAEGG